jgi:hypothetical protein
MAKNSSSVAVPEDLEGELLAISKNGLSVNMVVDGRTPYVETRISQTEL